MLEKITVVENHEMLLVSKRAVFVFIGALLLMTLALMSFFLLADFDYILGRKDLAMKVGQTSISLDQLKQIKRISGIRSQNVPDAVFATEFFETLLLSEGGRKLGIDRKPEFVKRIADFDGAVRNASDDETIARAVFLIEELADATRASIINQGTDTTDISTDKASIPSPKIKLHLHTILLPVASLTQLIMTEQASGTTFAELNASWSVSLYKGVGGDIGWKTEQDFPEGVFAKLLTQPINTLSEGFSDAAGTHLFTVVSKQEENPATAARAIREQQTREMKKKRLARYVIELRNQIEYWINPALQIKCQVATR